ncbi:MAG: DUF4013 domain-containing protein [Nanoarchaeota archaeon]|nr:DUF4013 domain-containing protein [Nanoarchaeota archaeon]
MKTLDFKSAFKYPFNRAKGLWNILWLFLPIFGWLALGGYGIRIVKEFSKGKFKKLPLFKFKSDLKLGFMMFIKALPFIIAYIALMATLSIINIWLRTVIDTLIQIFVIPILTVNFFNKETVASLFEFKILKAVFNNFGDYIMALLKSIGLGLIFLLMWIVLVGFPAGTFTKNIFIADFYRRRVK